MKLTGNVELAVAAALVGVIAFMPKVLGVVVDTAVGKAVAFGFVVWLWKQHNELVAVLLTVALLRAFPSYEHMKDDKKEKKDGERGEKAPSSKPSEAPKPLGGHD
jgi:hypothetical protein